MWTIDFSRIEPWLDTQSKETVASIFATLELLERQGPSLGRPLVDSIKGSRFGNLKELRPASPGRTEVRVLFAFDPRRQAIMLLAGDKSKGKNKKLRWAHWYKQAIPKAEQIFAEHLEALERAHE